MDLREFLDWAWQRHHNPLSWYIRPLFILPFCWFAWRRSVGGMLITVVAVLSSMFWFPVPDATDARAAAFLAMEREYASQPWGLAKVVMTALVPAWFILLGASFWQRSWLAGFLVINVGVLLKIVWSFAFGGESAWSIVLPVSAGLVATNGLLYYAYRRSQQRAASRDASQRATA